MKQELSKQLLRDPEQEPTHAIFRRVFDESVYEIMTKIEQVFIITGIDLEWKYYKDGKAWLGKATWKKKTIVWISAWENYIQASFYFTEKTHPGVLELRFDEEIKAAFAGACPTGKLIPLTIKIKGNKSLQDFNTLLNHKKTLL